MSDIIFKEVLDSEGQTQASETISDLVRQDLNPDGSVKIDIYTEEVGFHSIANPGWIKFELDGLYEISYIRFLLWDSCGNGKKQPSHRKYQYRLLYSEDSIHLKSARWTVLYDTMRNGSNGWQEFYFRNEPVQIRSIKIQCCNNSRDSATQIIKVQAYRYPTYEIATEFGQSVPNDAYAPSIHGIINNRIICGNNEEAGISKDIYNKVKNKLELLGEKIGKDDNNIRIFSLETEEKLDELDHIDNDISKFRTSLLEPVKEAIRRQKKQDERLHHINIVITVLAAVTILVDILRLVL